MGLTIHYGLKSDAANLDEAARLVQKLHVRATQLPLKKITEVITASGDDCDSERYDMKDIRRGLLLFAQDIRIEDDRMFRAPPLEACLFATSPGEGCEYARFGLCRYPDVGIPINTKFSDSEELRSHDLAPWRFRGFCKTQYASNPAYGGIDHFLECHGAVISMLDYAKDLGILSYVHDESRYWERRDNNTLTKAVMDANRTIAGLVQGLKEGITEIIDAPIEEYPNIHDLQRDRDVDGDLEV